MLPLSLSYDHRVIDGASGARFITFFGQALAAMATAEKEKAPARDKKTAKRAIKPRKTKTKSKKR